MTQNVTISYDTTAYNLCLDCSYYSIASFSPQDLHTMADRCFCFYLQSCKAQDNLKGFHKKKSQVIFEISTSCFLWRRINRWTGCRDHSTVTYWSSLDKALPFNSNWQESWLLNRELIISTAKTAAWSSLRDRNSAKRKTSIHHNGAPAILTPASRDNCVLPPNTLFSDKYRPSIDKYRQLCGAAKYSVFRLTRSHFNVATPTSSFLSSIIAFLIHQIKTIDFFGRQKA